MLAHPAFDLDWNLVRTFIAVSEGGSLAAGARSLGITHPTAARHIQLLEESLGVTLFTRSARGLMLNDMGHALVNVASRMHESAVAFQSRIDEIRSAPIRNVRIGVAEMFAELLPELLVRVVRENDATAGNDPCVDLLVSNDLVNLLERDADIAVRHVQPKQQDLICMHVGQLELGAFASADYVDRHGRLDGLDATGHRFLDGFSRDYFVRGAARRGISIAAEQISMRSDSSACLKAAISAGLGIGVLPKWVASRHDDWISVFPAEDRIELDVWLVARPDLRDSQPLLSLYRALGDAIADKLVAIA